MLANAAAHARQILAALRACEEALGTVLEACALRVTRRISQRMSHRTCETLRDTWRTSFLRNRCGAYRLTAPGNVTTPLAKGPLPDHVARLQTKLGVARVSGRQPGQKAWTTPLCQPRLARRPLRRAAPAGSGHLAWPADQADRFAGAVCID